VIELNYFERIGDLEARSTDSVGLNGNPKTGIHIVKWNKDLCYSVAYFVKDKEGYYLQFVGDRPFDKEISPADFMYLARRSQEALDLFFYDGVDLFYHEGEE